MNRSRLAATGAALLALAAPLVLRAATVVAQDRAGVGRLVEVAGRVELESAEGARALALPAGSRLEGLERLGQGWLVTGRIVEQGSSDLLVLRTDATGQIALPAPPGRTGRYRRGAVAFADDERLLGVAWLEGERPRTFDVRFSAWREGGFAAPVVVSPAGPGTQIALAGCRLADGRLFLVWAGFDGHDDEIWYATGDDAGRWSRPERVADDNATPDVTPAVAAWGGGALVSWARFDGSEYRLMTARLDGRAMRDARWAAPAGSLEPSIEIGPRGPALLYRDARADAWTVTELATGGNPARTVSLAGGGAQRPFVRLEAGGVRWRLGDAESVTDWR